MEDIAWVSSAQQSYNRIAGNVTGASVRSTSLLTSAQNKQLKTGTKKKYEN